MLKSKKSSVLCTILTVILLVIIFCFTSLLMYNYFLSDSLNNLNQTGSVSLNCEKAATKNQLNKFIED
jgi:amino acid permease